jgi:thiol-disulfide isomerase/thioredoxin
MCDPGMCSRSLRGWIARTVARPFRRFAPALMVLLSVGAASAGITLAADLHDSVASPFSLPDLDGRTRSLKEFLGVKPVLLEFMSTDCPHCRHMGPILTRLHAVYGDRISFLTVAFDRHATRVKAFAEAHGHPWCYLIGDDNTARVYTLEGVPTFLLLGPDGRIRATQVGSCPYDELAQVIQAVIGTR